LDQLVQLAVLKGQFEFIQTFRNGNGSRAVAGPIILYDT
jgi:hypothetical protein